MGDNENGDNLNNHQDSGSGAHHDAAPQQQQNNMSHQQQPQQQQHNEHNKQQQQQRDDVCRDFLKNICNRGSRCKFYHPSEAPPISDHDYNFCIDYQVRMAMIRFFLGAPGSKKIEF